MLKATPRAQVPAGTPGLLLTHASLCVLVCVAAEESGGPLLAAYGGGSRGRMRGRTLRLDESDARDVCVCP